MLDDDSPGFGVDFQIDGGASIAEVTRLAQVFESTEAKILTEATRIEQATGGMIKLAGATAEVKTFGLAATRELAATSREMRAVEKSGEAMVRQLERQSAEFGKTREELRGLRAEEKALAAERTDNSNLANRIRAAESELYDKEFAAARRASNEATAAAEDKTEAAAKAIRAIEAEERRLREADHAYQMFEARRRKGLAEWKEVEAAQARSTAEAAVNTQLLERSRIEAALARTTGSDRPRATDAGATYGALAGKFAEEEAAALRMQAAAAATAAREHEALAAAVRGSHAAQLADADAAERLRMATDPLYAATKRLNDEIAESTRLYIAGATPPAEYARQQEILTGRLGEVARQHAPANRAMGDLGGTGKLAGHHMQNLAFQFQDLGVQMASAAGSSAPVKMALMAIIQQGAQIQGIMSQAGIGVRGVASAFWTLLAPFAPIIIAVGATYAAFKLFQKSFDDDASQKKFIAGLGLTKAEMKQLGDTSLTAGDVIKGVWKTISDATGIDEYFAGVGKRVDEAGKAIVKGAVSVALGIPAAMYAAYQTVVAHWETLPQVFGSIFTRAFNFAIREINTFMKESVAGLNALAKGANGLLGMDVFGTLTAPQLDQVKDRYAGAGDAAGKTFMTNFNKVMKKGRGLLDTIGNDIESVNHARLTKEANKIKADRTPKRDRHAEQLAREAEAMEAQIRNLYALAEAYGVSGAAALIAEARVKAESAAIKKRADIEAMVDRQIRLAIAQRVADAAKSAAAMREEAAIQAQVNAMVASGLVPAERANDLVRDRIADLPLLAAIEAAQQRGLKVEVDKATAALHAQQDARARLKAGEAGAFYAGANQQADRQLAMQREELRLVGATDMERVRAMATLQATQTLQAKGYALATADANAYVAKQVEIAVGAEQIRQAQDAWNASLGYTADLFDEIDRSVQNAASGMADAFGEVGRTIGDVAGIMSGYYADQARLQQDHDAAIRKAAGNQAAIAHEQQLFAMRSSSMQIGAYGDMLSAAKGFFKEGSAGYKAIAAAEKVYRIAQLAMSIAAMVQNTAETTVSVANAGLRATADGTAGIAAQAKLPFPANIAAMAATGAALVAAGVAIFGGGRGSKSPEPVTNTGTGTVLGDANAKSESLQRSIDQLREVDTVTSVFARQMAGSLRSIDNQIGGLAAVLVRSGNIDASAGVTEGFKTNAIGSVLKSVVPVFGSALASLFGTKTTVVGSGLFGSAQSVGDILAGGFDAQTYSDVQKKKKLFGITTSTKTSTQYAGADADLENQFTLILRSFATAIAGAAGPLEQATGDVQARLNGFVVDIGKIDLKGLTGTEIQEKLEAVFGAAADGMAQAAFPGVARFQKAGEGAFETLVRVASTLESVSSSLDMLGTASRAMSIDAKLGLADQFDSVSDLTNAVEAYFSTYFTAAEQSAAKTAQLTRVFDSMGMAMPETLTGFRQLVEAQDLTTAAGQATYATLLQLAPAFADLQAALGGTKSAVDIAAERADLERRLLELRGDTAAIRAADLAKLDASNRALQQEIYAVQDAQDAAKAAADLAKAWTSVGDSIMDEVNRIRGLTDAGGGDTFQTLLGRFNDANLAARAGDMDAAKSLPALSQALLGRAADIATSSQELARVQAQTAAALEATYGIIGSRSGQKASSTTETVSSAADSRGAATSTAPANDALIGEIKSLRAEVAGMRSENNSGQAAIVGNTARTARKLEDVTAASGGEAISVANAA